MWRGDCRAARGPNTKVIGVQAEGASAVSQSWKTGQWQETAEAATWAEGVATRRPANLTLELMRSVLDDAVLVSDDELRRACRLILEQTHNIAEGAGAAALAGAIKTARAVGRKNGGRHRIGGKSRSESAPRDSGRRLSFVR